MEPVLRVRGDVDCQRLEAAADLSGAMAAAIERVAGEGWQAEVTSLRS
jgi:hypothetical protein